MARRRPSFLGKTAIAGVGYTKFSKNSGVSVLHLANDACRAAVADAGMEPAEVDGIVSYSLFGDSVTVQAVAASLGSRELTYALDLNLGGQAACYAVSLAAMAVEAGMATNVLVFRALNGRSGLRVGSQSFQSPTAQYRYPIGLTAFPQLIGLWARRFMIETGATSDDFAAVVMAQREYAALNERAIRRRPMTIGDYYDSPFVVDPYRVADCTDEVDGACAVLVTSAERAQAGPHTPVAIRGAAWVTPSGSGIDVGDFFSWPDWSRNAHSYLADRLWESAGLRPADVDFAELYDCFSSVVLFGLEGLGLVERGGSGEFVRDGQTRAGGALPVNTHGGLLSEGYLHGMNTLTEAVLQVQGRSGSRQLARADTCVVTSGALHDGSALVLSKEFA